MGRPLNSRYFGATADSGGEMSEDENLSVTVKIGSNAVSTSGIVLSQRSETRFRVNDASDGSGNSGVCELVNKSVPGDDEMVVVGVINSSGDEVNIRKFHNRTVFDFDDNRYTWEIQDDSADHNILVLFEI